MEYRVRVCGSPQRTDKNGMQAVRLLVTFAGTKAYLSTKIKWEPEDITPDGLKQGAQSAKALNEASKAIAELKDKIFRAFEENNISNPEDLKYCLANKGGKQCFLLYWDRKASERYRLNQISYKTLGDQLASLNTLKQTVHILRFSDINLKFIETYKAWLQGKGYSRNTVWGRLKDFRTYLNLAKKDGLTNQYPFSDFKMPKPQSRIEYLTENEFILLRNYFEKTDNYHHREALRPFLFSCYTGLRVSDVQAIRRKNFKTPDLLLYEPMKTRRSETKKFLDLEVPVHPYAKGLIDLAIRKEGRIFRNIVSEQKLNAHFKNIAKELGITPFSFHYSRHTFATRFLRHGGKIEVLQKLLGHENIETTMLYVHIEPSHAANQISLLT